MKRPFNFYLQIPQMKMKKKLNGKLHTTIKNKILYV